MIGQETRVAVIAGAHRIGHAGHLFLNPDGIAFGTAIQYQAPR